MSGTEDRTPTSIVVMGVSGAGKSTVAELLAARLGWTMSEADRFHTADNIAKMSAGTPLGDADRLPWLRAIQRWIDDRARAGQDTVLACSALKRSYRDILRGADATVRFVHLDGTAELFSERLLHRSGHFMPASLLRSQMADLEGVDADEESIVIDAAAPPEHIVHTTLDLLDLDR